MQMINLNQNYFLWTHFAGVQFYMKLVLYLENIVIFRLLTCHNVCPFSPKTDFHLWRRGGPSESNSPDKGMVNYFTIAKVVIVWSLLRLFKCGNSEKNT